MVEAVLVANRVVIARCEVDVHVHCSWHLHSQGKEPLVLKLRLSMPYRLSAAQTLIEAEGNSECLRRCFLEQGPGA